ncbi:hypothetical protein EGH10_02900 [Brevibacillus laterosporus]|uniref:Lipoprotein n=1 Tax=Brevibacillus laterosporus LMG 15441 TaxID=1042163 RepID=A0A075QZW8_BRELA|nr:hypothetical protein [Brevibacillus laterosporus]AIG25159.1 hypothetical protein BRLA_c008180 [Brevibacillus laterosporus LMG 15441]RJL07038.1 hypothetical protein DM460_21225 [Brevibacillus laterosporus]TPH17965.1 hypothetical protein EGH10_02900 [Brevibacillus laterosporus]HAS01191.1 hypothetical protein [Brevibacillus sp.]
MVCNDRLRKRIIVLPIIAILLAGCGNGVQATPDSEKSGQIVKSGATATVLEENKDHTKQIPQPNNPVSSKGQPPAQTRELTYTIDGKKVSEQAQLFESHLGYFLYYLPDFTATGEEPGKDMLFYEKNDRYAVRIEQMPDKVDLAAQKKLMEVELSDLGNVRNLKKEQETDPFLQKTALHLGVDTKNDHKEIIVTKIDSRWFRFTVFAPNETENAVILPKIWAMLKTIMVKE